MAIIVPSPLDLAFTIYGIPWPDIDEQAIADFGKDFDELCEAVTEFGRAVDGLLGVLSDRSRSDAFDAVTEQWAAMCNRDVFPVIDSAGDGVRTGTQVASNLITSYKASLIVYLSVNVAVDLAALAVPGPGTAVAAARAAMTRVALRIAFHEMMESFAGLVVKELGEVFERLVISPIEQMFASVREAIVGWMAGEVVANAALRRATTSTAGALYIDYHDVIEATTTLRRAYTDLESKLSAFDIHVGHQEFVEPDHHGAERDSGMRSHVREIIQWSIGAIVRLLVDVGDTVMNDLCELVVRTYEAYVSADTALAAEARALREELLLRPGRMPYLIDRTTRPRPTVVWENPPEEVFTGQGVSDARFDITVIDLPDAPDPVITGAAVSEARFDITVIDLVDAPDPVATGGGESTARDGIRTITLPDLTVHGGAAHEREDIR